MPSVFPDHEEAVSYVVGPESITWQKTSDLRGMFGSGTALLLQVAHPTVAGGVREHSDFVSDPWNRLYRTLDYVNLLVYGGVEGAINTGRQMRAMHQRIKGVDPQGRRYHALEPQAYAWVHATLAYSIVETHNMFGVPFSQAEKVQFYGEWRGLGRLLGIRERDMPETWWAFNDYVETMIDEELENNDVVELVHRTLASPATPPIDWLGDRTWGVITKPAARAMQLATAGLLPESARRKLGLQLTPWQEREIRTIGRIVRASTPVLPKSVRNNGPAYLRWRRETIERGPFRIPAPGTMERTPVAA